MELGAVGAGRRATLQLHYQNNGNVPVGAFSITDTLPVSTTFVSAWINGTASRLTPSLIGDGYVVWDFPGLDNGYYGNFEVVVGWTPDANPAQCWSTPPRSHTCPARTATTTT